MFSDRKQLLTILENQYRPLLEKGDYVIKFNYRNYVFYGPGLTKSRKSYYNHQLITPITNKIYWVYINKNTFYRLYNQDSGCNTLFAMNVGESGTNEFPIEQIDDIIKELCETETYQICILLMKYIVESLHCNKITGGLLDNTLSTVIDDKGDCTLSLYKHFSECKNFDNNIFNLSLF